MTEQLNLQKDKFLENTERLNNYNEIYNINSYVKEAKKVEKGSLKEMNDNLHTRILDLKHKYMLNERNTLMYRFRIHMLWNTALIICILLYFINQYSSGVMSLNTLLIASLILLLIYFPIAFWVIYNQTYRRKTDFHRVYWELDSGRKPTY